MKILLRFLRGLSYAFTFGRIKGTLDYTGAQGIIAIPFGGHADGDPVGVANQGIATLARELALKTDLPIAGQWEFEDAKPSLCMRFTYGLRGQHHINTQEILSSLIERTNWGKVILVAHPDHMRRCVWVLEKLGVQAIVPEEHRLLRYDPTSRQVWCRQKWLPLPISRNPENWGFWWFERGARMIFALRGWI